MASSTKERLWTKSFGSSDQKAQMDSICNHIIADYVVGNEKMKHLLTSLGFQETGFIEEK